MANIVRKTGVFNTIIPIEKVIKKEIGTIETLDRKALLKINSSIVNFSSEIKINVETLKEKLAYIDDRNNSIQTKIDSLKNINSLDSTLMNSLNGIIFELEELRPVINEFISLSDKTINDFQISGKAIIYTQDTKTFILELSDNLKKIKDKKLIFDRVISEIQKRLAALNTGRTQLNSSNLVDWDDDPTVFENTSIGLGHILTFKQVWKSDGYSIGDVEGSVVLQPMQIKQVATLDWTRKDVASRTEDLSNIEEIRNTVSRDSDTQEIISAAFSEDITANSQASSKSRGGSIGGSLAGGIGGAIFGISGGYQSNSQSSKTSSAQNSGRNLASNALQSLRDKIQQSAASVRSQRSTVIQTVSQSESATATTEIIANYNRRHALTTMWFSINRHFVIEQELADVQECLFFPMPMTVFDEEKIFRWRDVLKNSLIDKSHLPAFEAIDRIVNKYEGINFPNKRYCDESVDYIEGEFTISFEIPRIPDPDELELEAAKNSNEQDRIERAINRRNDVLISLFNPFYYLLRRSFSRPKDAYLNKLQNEIKEKRDFTYEKEIVPVMVNSIVGDYLKLYRNHSRGSKALKADFTLVDKYDSLVTLRNDYTGRGQYRYSTPKGRPLRIRFTVSDFSEISRADIKNLFLGLKLDDDLIRINSPDEEALPSPGLPDGVRIIVHSANIRYTTQFGTYKLYGNRDIKNDLKYNDDDGAKMETTKMSFIEVQNPKYEDKRKSAMLINHLNQHLEFYHRMIWMNMDTSRLFRLMDGYIAPNSNGRSVASVVESHPIGVIGNNIILKVVPGANLDPFHKINESNGITLFDHYKPERPSPPFRITTKNPGLYGESILGKCESAETIDDSKLWKYEDLKIPYLPSDIQPIGLDSRYQNPGNLQAKDFAQPMINMQTLTPDSLKDSALKEALSLLGKGDSFRDATGLEGTQGLVKNAQNQNTDILKNATDSANKAMELGSNYSINRQKQDIEAYKEFSKNASPEQKAALQKTLLDSWGKDTKAVQDAINSANKVSEKQANIAAERNPNNTLQQTIDAAKPGTDIDAIINSDGSAEVKLTKTDNTNWTLPGANPDRLLSLAKKHKLIQSLNENSNNLCWLYCLCLTILNNTNLKENESPINFILDTIDSNNKYKYKDDQNYNITIK